MKTQNWYDYPQYYDLAFRDETGPEADFLEAACKKYALHPVKRMLEPGCGGGRLVVELARRGYDMVGFDNNATSVAFVHKQLARARRQADVYLDDMTDFSLVEPVDAAFNTYNTFRHLTTEEAASSHLRCVADAVRPGGVYVLGLHLLPPDASDECTERWIARSGQTKVVFTLRVLATDRRKRIENLRVTMKVSGPKLERDLRLATEFPLRMYTARQMRQLLEKTPQFELCDVYDFNYEIDEPLKLNNEISDTVFILRRR